MKICSFCGAENEDSVVCCGNNEDLFTEPHTIFYEADEKIGTKRWNSFSEEWNDYKWIEENSDAHEFSNGKGEIRLKKNVSAIWDNAFENCNKLKSVIIPNTITQIGICAFGDCTNLTSVVMPNSITSIGEYAFANCENLKSIFIPQSVTLINESAFLSCYSLTSIIVDKNNPIYDSRENCNAIIETKTNVLHTGCTNTAIPNSVTEIGNYAFFSRFELKSIVIPNSVTKISDYAFAHCNELTSIVIPDSVIEIGDNAFYCAFYSSNGQTSIVVPDSVTKIGSMAFGGIQNIVYNGSAPTEYSGVLTVNGFFDGDFIYSDESKTKIIACNNQITDVNVPDSVVEIGKYAFHRCNLTSINIPNSVQIIGVGAFEQCEKLRDITLPRLLRKIEEYTFDYCTSLVSIDVPDSVIEIADNAFLNCSNLAKDTIKKIRKINKKALYYLD